jgi:5-methylthioadenosine/S-adenosylhomocysteine deaminase
MQACDTLISASWCIAVEPSTRPLANYSVAIQGGRIVDLLPSVQAREKYRPDAVIERPGHVLLPGLINTHTRAALSLFRGLGAAFDTQRWLSEEMVRDGTELAIAEMLRGGVTCFGDSFYFPDVVAETAIAAHMRASIGMAVADAPSPWAENADEYLAKGADLVHDRFAGHPLLATHFALLDAARLTDDTLRETRVMADQVNAPVHASLHRTPEDIQASLDNAGQRPLERLRNAGLVNANMLGTHGVFLDNTELAYLAREGVAIAICPRADADLGEAHRIAQRLLGAAVTVAIGTDSALRCHTLDLFADMRSAFCHTASDGDEAQRLAASALRAVTINAAKALQIGDSVGSIEIGKQADLCCINLGALNSQPMHAPLVQLVYTVQRDQVSDAWVAGRQLLDNGRLTHIDQADLLLRCKEWQRRIFENR